MPGNPQTTHAEEVARDGWALFRDGQQISKAHSTEAAAMAEAYERGAIVQDRSNRWVAWGYSVRRIITQPTGGNDG